jgi:hypothetical protein
VSISERTPWRVEVTLHIAASSPYGYAPAARQACSGRMWVPLSVLLNQTNSGTKQHLRKPALCKVMFCSALLCSAPSATCYLFVVCRLSATLLSSEGCIVGSHEAKSHENYHSALMLPPPLWLAGRMCCAVCKCRRVNCEML